MCTCDATAADEVGAYMRWCFAACAKDAGAVHPVCAAGTNCWSCAERGGACQLLATCAQTFDAFVSTAAAETAKSTHACPFAAHRFRQLHDGGSTFAVPAWLSMVTSFDFVMRATHCAVEHVFCRRVCECYGASTFAGTADERCAWPSTVILIDFVMRATRCAVEHVVCRGVCECQLHNGVSTFAGTADERCAWLSTVTSFDFVMRATHCAVEHVFCRSVCE